jgi:tetratricopeptide (TPR) repeat protein
MIRAVPLLKAIIVVLAVVLVLIAAAVVRQLVVGSTAGVPRSELERGALSAEEAVKADPNDAAARVKLAAAYLEEHANAAALEQAKIAVRLAPQDPSGYYVLGLAKDASGDPKGALDALRTAATTTGQLAGFYQDAYTALARVQEELGDRKGALVSMGQAIDNGPENAVLLLTRGQMYERDKQYVNALDDYSSALQYVPDYPEARAAFDRLSRAHPEALAELKQRARQAPPAKKTTRTAPKPGAPGR